MPDNQLNHPSLEWGVVDPVGEQCLVVSWTIQGCSVGWWIHVGVPTTETCIVLSNSLSFNNGGWSSAVTKVRVLPMSHGCLEWSSGSLDIRCRPGKKSWSTVNLINTFIVTWNFVMLCTRFLQIKTIRAALHGFYCLFWTQCTYKQIYYCNVFVTSGTNTRFVTKQSGWWIGSDFLRIKNVPGFHLCLN